MSGEQNKLNFIEQVEACRPGSNDLRAEEFALAAERIASDAEARHYYERVQLADSRVAMAFHDVAVPEGLADRLLAALDAASPLPGAATDSPIEPVEIKTPPATLSTRRLVLRLAIAASLLGVIGGGLALVSGLTPYSNQQCLAEAKQAGAQLKPDRWTNMRATPAPAERQPKTRLFGSVKSWQAAPLLGDDRAVAYRFTNGATLFVCQPGKTVASLPIAPPAVPQQKAGQSSGTQIGVWTSGGLVHVLMVNGPLDEYRRMTGTTRPVVAHARPQSLPSRYDG